LFKKNKYTKYIKWEEVYNFIKQGITHGHMFLQRHLIIIKIQTRKMLQRRLLVNPTFYLDLIKELAQTSYIVKRLLSRQNT